MSVRSLTALTLAMLVATLSPATAQDSKQNSDNTPAVIDSDTLKAGEYMGKLAVPPGTDGQFTLRIEHYEPKDAAAARKAVNQLNADVQRARQLEQQVAVNGTNQQLHDLNQLHISIRKRLAQQSDLFNVVGQDIEFHAADAMIVRWLLPPVIYNDKGERKKLTPLDLEEMRGFDRSLPGYEAKLSDLQVNQMIRVSLRPAKAASTTASKSTSGSDKKKTPKMEAAMVVIVLADDLTPVTGDKAKKK
jgi:hypothetical protein